MQSTRLWSLGHLSKTSLFWLSDTLNFPKSNPQIQMHNGVRVHPYAHPQHINEVNPFVCI